MAAAVFPFLGPVGAAQDVKAKPAVRDLLIKPGVAEVVGDVVCNGDFGTNVKFVKTPSDAGRQALKEEKLVFVLHVSGQFEDPDFT